jgi:hypothetical protein
VAADLHGPAVEVFAVEELDPFFNGVVSRDGETRRTQQWRRNDEQQM